jgi:hypothetical protein
MKMAKRKAAKAPKRARSEVINMKPHLMAKRFQLPDYCSIREVVMRELDGQDDIEASIWADKNATSAIKGSAVAAMVADQRESIRLSLLEVDGTPVNHDGIPFMAMDDFTSVTFRFLLQFYSDMNGAKEDDLKNAIAGAEIVNPNHPHSDSPEAEPIHE